MTLTSYLPYIVGVEMLIFAVVGVALLWHYKIKQRYIAQFYKTIQTGSFGSRLIQKIGQKDFNPQDETVRFNKQSFPIVFSKMSYQEGAHKIWAFDLDSNIGLTFGGHYDVGDTKFIDAVLESGIIKQFVQFAGKLDTTTYLIIGLFAVVGILAFISGLFASPYILPSGV